MDEKGSNESDRDEKGSNESVMDEKGEQQSPEGRTPPRRNCSWKEEPLPLCGPLDTLYFVLSCIPSLDLLLQSFGGMY